MSELLSVFLSHKKLQHYGPHTFGGMFIRQQEIF